MARTRLAAHGTRARYLHRSRRCRCRACKAANAAYIAAYRARRRLPRYEQLVLPDEYLPQPVAA